MTAVCTGSNPVGAVFYKRNNINIDWKLEYSNYFLRGQYYAIWLPNHPRSTKDGYVYIHILQAEKIVGRVLYNNECVHLKDFNKLNNNVDNLMIFASKADHTSFHSGNNDIYCIDNIWYTNKKCIIRNNDHNCPICGNLKYYRATMCQKCEYKSRESKIRPSKEILEKWILFYPMTYIGKMFGVSDKCIVKWCKYYGILFYYNDIQEYRSKNPINIITPIYFE